MAGVGAGVFLLGGGVAVEHRSHGPITNGMDGNLPAGSVRLHDQTVQPSLFHLEVAVVAGFTFEVIEHRSGATDQ